MRNIIVRPTCIENLECLLSPSRDRITHAIAQNAVAYPIYRASLPPQRVIPFALHRRVRPFLNDDAILRHSDMGPTLLAAGARTFLPSYRSSPLIERWTEEHGLELLSPRIRLQHQLEHKIKFHRLLQEYQLPVPRSWIVTLPQQLKELTGFPLVCQVPGSEGMEGTFLLRSRRQLQRQLKTETLRLPLLFRKFVDGAALGITIIVGAQDLVLSAVRRQCRELSHRQDLAGVQWIPSRDFTAAQRKRITVVMRQLGQALQRTGFLGAASIDFLLAGEDVWIIECNPRFTSSTPQLSADPRLLHGLDFIEEYVHAVRGQPLGPTPPGLPKVSFQGAYTDISEQIVNLMRAAGRRMIQELPPPGVYDFSGDTLSFKSADVKYLPGVNRLLFHYSTPAGARCTNRSDYGSLLTNFQLFDFSQGRTVLTPRAVSLIHQLYAGIRFARPAQTLLDLQSSDQQR